MKDKLLQRALVIDSWNDAWEIQAAIFTRIKRVCGWAQSNKCFDDKERFEECIEKIKRLCFFYKRLEQIRINVVEVKNEKKTINT